MTGMWGGRFAGGLDSAFESFNRSLPFDHRLIAEDLRGSRAWAAALGRCGVLADDDVAQLDAALAELETELASDPSAFAQSNAEDVHSFVEAALASKVGDLARKLHTGRSRNDQVATDMRLFTRTQSSALTGATRELMQALVALAKRYQSLPLPGYTHLQKAQPVTVGHHALAYVEMLARDLERFEQAAQRADVSPLGSGALAGSGFPIDREQLASALGFERGASGNSLDAVSDRDFVIELTFTCSLTLTHLSRLAEDWIFYATHEAGFLALSDAVSTGSSLMPQKKNPDGLELVRGKAARVGGHLSALLSLLKGLPLAYNKDLQEDKEALFDALDTTLACLQVTTRIVQEATFDVERCRTAATQGLLNATDVADALVRAGVPFRDAHERAGKLVLAALERGVEIEDLPPEILNDQLAELEGDLREHLSVDAVLARRDVFGGTAPERVAQRIAHWEAEAGQ